MSDPRRALPSVDAVMGRPEVRALVNEHPRAIVVDAVRDALAGRREDGSGADGLGGDVAARLRPSLRRVINATGVLRNTNLGRAPMAEPAIRAAEAAAGYASVEWDIV
ncbi:MAG: L-seryl-tRNA(Sec) selenium transferase, partial [Miltoncostaeaceae bacterium]